MKHQGEGTAIIRPLPQRIQPPPNVADSGLVMGRSSQDEQYNEISTIEMDKEPAHIISLSGTPDRLVTPPITAPKFVRPVALKLKVARPIPKPAIEQFYEESFQQGINAEQVHEATALAQDWHRKWTQQDELGHTMPVPEADMDKAMFAAQESNELALSTSMLDYEDVYNDRIFGAKNPSPEDVHEDFFERKRLRLIANESLSSLSLNSKPNEDESDRVPSSKRRITSSAGSHDLCWPTPSEWPLSTNRISPPLCLPEGVIKPTALRVARPLTESERNDDLKSRQCPPSYDQIPDGIIKVRKSQTSALSPLTVPSVTSSYCAPRPAVVEDDTPRQTPILKPNGIPSVVSHPFKKVKAPLRSIMVEDARESLLHRLAVTSGDVVTDQEFLKHLDVLKQHYAATQVDTRSSTSDVNATSEGMWLTLTKPTYFGNLGNNDDGDPMYTLGRMSFDMFSPTRLVCSLQGNFNSVERIEDDDRKAMLQNVPKALKEEVGSGATVLRSYDIVTAFTIEPHLAEWPDAPNKDVRRPIRGIMTTKGYTLPDPDTPNRHSVWITGGNIEPNNDPVDQREWKRQFAKNPPKHGLGEQAKLLAVKLLMGATLPTQMEEDGSLTYTFQRPLGGHGLAYVDTLYVDGSLRIVQGHRGTIFVFSKLAENKER